MTHYAYVSHVAIPDIIKFGSISPARHLELGPLLRAEASNNNELKTCQISPISTLKLYPLYDINEPMCIVLRWNGAMQLILDPSPRLFKAEPTRNPSIGTLHVNTFARNGKRECQ